MVIHALKVGLAIAGRGIHLLVVRVNALVGENVARHCECGDRENSGRCEEAMSVSDLSDGSSLLCQATVFDSGKIFKWCEAQEIGWNGRESG